MGLKQAGVHDRLPLPFIFSHAFQFHYFIFRKSRSYTILRLTMVGLPSTMVYPGTTMVLFAVDGTQFNPWGSMVRFDGLSVLIVVLFRLILW
jgi:hypothetical protein